MALKYSISQIYGGVAAIDVVNALAVASACSDK